MNALEEWRAELARGLADHMGCSLPAVEEAVASVTSDWKVNQCCPHMTTTPVHYLITTMDHCR